MEIKTCEEYVINRALALEEENNELKAEVKSLEGVIALNEEDFKFLQQVFNIYAYIDGAGDRSINASGFYESKYNDKKGKDVDHVMRIFNLTIDEDE